MQAWSGYYSAIATAAAALLGLLFVAISINAESLGPGHESSRRLAEQGFSNYFAVLILALVALFPGISFETMGLVAISVTVVGSIWVLIRFWQSLREARQAKSRASSVRRHASSVVGFGMLLYAAVGMRFGSANEAMPYIFAAALIVLISSATTASWELLLRISRFRQPR